MAKKMFLNRQRAIPTTEPQSTLEMPLPVRNSRQLGEGGELPFDIIRETSKTFSKFNTTGRSVVIKFKPVKQNQQPNLYLKECITALTNYLVDDVPDRDLVGLRIRN